MKPPKNLKTVLFFLVVIALLACNEADEATNVTDKHLIGTWQRNDVSELFEYKLFFNEKNKGYSTTYEGHGDGTSISALREFVWHTDNKVLTLDFDGEIMTTRYSINAEGQLLLSEFPEFHFIKLE